jgi:CRP-like cAMP-binding protein
MNEAELVEILRLGADFARVSEGALAELVRAGVAVEPAEGAEIIRQGEPTHQVWIHLDGVLEVVVDGEIVNRIEQGGEVVGQISAVSYVPATATVRVAGRAKCLSVPNRSLHGLIGAHPDLAEALLRSMAKYLGTR